MKLYWIAVVRRNTEHGPVIVVSPHCILARDEDHAKLMAGRKIPDGESSSGLEVHVSPF